MAPVAVAIMAKAPRAGEVKTRLCPPLSLADAAELYRRFLFDKIEQVRSLRTASLAIAYTPAEARVFFEQVAPGFVLVPQRGADLGDRLANSLGELLDQGYRGRWRSTATRRRCLLDSWSRRSTSSQRPRSMSCSAPPRMAATT